jgi:hypothetical protein
MVRPMLLCLLPKYRHLSPFICKTRETLLFTTKGVILKERTEEEKKKKKNKNKRDVM